MSAAESGLSARPVPESLVSMSTEGDDGVIALGGQASLSTVPALMSMGTRALAVDDGAVVVDLAGTGFVDSATMRVPGGDGESLDLVDRRLTMRLPSGPAVQPLTALGLSHLVAPPPPAPPTKGRSARFSIAIGRDLGTVVVTVHGEVDAPAASHLGAILADLIDGQGNLCLVVDLADATAADGGSLPVFAVAAERARQRGGVLTLSHARAGLLESLREAGLGELIALPFDGGGHRHPEAAPSFASQRERSVHPAGSDRPLGRPAAPGSR